MGTLEIIQDYLENDVYRRSFNDLARETFGLDFEDWYKKKYFKGKYTCYSYVVDDQVIANISANEMEVVIKGEVKKAIQLGTVMTRKDCRGNGLAGKLMKHVLKIYENQCDFIYLFANDTVLEFYPKFGFKKVIEANYTLSTDRVDKKESTIIELQVGTSFTNTLIDRLIQKRVPISKTWGIVEDTWPLEVYCKEGFKDNLYYIKEDDLIVIAGRKDGILHLYDIISDTPFDLDHIVEKFILEEDKMIQFHFVPELESYKPVCTYVERPDDTLFMKGIELDEDCEVLFPMTSQT